MVVKLKREVMIEILVITLFVMAFCTHISIVLFQNNTIFSIVFNLSYLILICLCVCFFKIYKIQIEIMSMIYLAVISVVLNLFLYNGNINFEFFKNLIFFITTNLFFYICSRINITSRLYHYVLILPCILMIADIVSFYFLNNEESLGGGITLGFTNPNFTGAWVSVVVMFNLILLFKAKKIWQKLFLILGLMIESNLSLKTASRNAIISMIFFFILIVVMTLLKKTFVNKFIVIICLIAPLLFSVIYVNVIDKPIMIEKFSFLVSEGKNLNSRIGVWTYGFDIMKQHPIVGSYYNVNNYIFSQLHNTAIDVCAKYGCIVYIIFIIFNYDILKKMQIQNSTNRYMTQMIGVVSLLSIFIQGIFEAGLYSGYGGLNYMIAGFIIVARYNDL